jgi:cobyrinic acid a,c-diamide synthase
LSGLVPRVVIAGARSGVGKTSISIGLAGALGQRGLRVQPFKTGPDFLDPTYLTIAAGRCCYNLDGWMMGEEYVRALFGKVSSGASLSLIEGAMGLFDGADPASCEGSSAQAAILLQAPVLLVADAHGMSRSLAALVKGYAEFEPGLRLAGVILNRVGSLRHATWIAESIKASGLPPVLGAIPEGALPPLSSRHLGLVSADEDTLPSATVERLVDAVEKHLDVAKIIEVASAAGACPMGRWSEESTHTRGVRIGLARDKAFHFYYHDNLEALSQRGAEVIEFSPLEDDRLPEKLDALYLGGGYPEVHAEGLAANQPMLQAVRDFAQSGKPIYAECGGLMYLTSGIETIDGEHQELAGVIPVRTRMLQKRKALGYVEVSLLADSFFGARGSRVRGHEFHYSELSGDGSQPMPGWGKAYELKRRRMEGIEREGFIRGRVLATYVHAHFASRPGAADSFVRLCAGGENPPSAPLCKGGDRGICLRKRERVGCVEENGVESGS